VADEAPKAKKPRKSRKVQEAEASQAAEELSNTIALEAWRKAELVEDALECQERQEYKEYVEGSDMAVLPEAAPEVPKGWDSVDTSTEDTVAVQPVMSARERVSSWLAKHNAETPIPATVKVHQANLLEWQVIDRKARKVGSDDMTSAANVLKYGKEAGLRTSRAGEVSEVELAATLAQGIQSALSMSLAGDYEGSMQKAYFCLHTAKENPRVGGLKVDCRDGKERRVIDVLGWFANNRQKVVEDIAFAKEEQAILDAELAAAEAAEQADAEAKANHRAEVQKRVAEILGDSKKRAA
jgi:hypothetical protein